MAPTEQRMKNKKFTSKDGNWNKSRRNPQCVKQKRKWVPEHKVYEGSVKEGQGFAFKRKQKVQHEYNKMLRKERKKNPETSALYKEEYPEHLRHLYEAEAQMLKKEAWTNRMNRSKLRMKKEEEEEEEETCEGTATADVEDPGPGPGLEVPGGSEQTDSGPGNPEPPAASEKDSLPMSNRMRKKLQKKTSYQKTKEEFETATEKRKKKKEEYLKNQKQREEAIQKYKQKKLETFQMLSKKTKKGQPNLNVQMEYLLQKISQRTAK